MMKTRFPVWMAALFVIATLAMACTLLAVTAHAQQPQDQSQTQPATGSIPVIKAETRLVLVDAIVTDKKGNYLRDLTQKDFRVWEDNAEQPIKTFSFETTASPADSQSRYLVLFFDDSTMKGDDQVRARQAAAKFIQANAGPNRYIAIVDFTGSVRVSQNFTADAERLKQVVRDVKFSSTSANVEAVQVASLGAPPMLRAQADFGARTLLLGVRSVARNLAALPGRKSLVLLTVGFPLTPDRESELTAVINVCNRANVAVYPIDVSGLTTGISPAEAGGSARLDMPAEAGVPRLVDASFHYYANLTGDMQSGGAGQRGGGDGGRGGSGGGAGGKGSTGTGTGGMGGGNKGGAGSGGAGGGKGTPGGSPGYTPVTSRGQSYNQPRQIMPVVPPTTATNQQVLYSLAAGTGGFVIVNSNDLLAGLEKIAKEENEYYVLGYVPALSDEGSCHTLRVKVERSGTVVRSRSGYCNVRAADPLAGKPVEQLLQARATSPDAGNIPASMLAPYFYTSPNTARVDLAMEIPPGAIVFTKQKGKFHASVDVLGLAYKPDGTIGARFSDTVPLEFDDKKEVEQFTKQPLHYGHQFEAAPGHYNLKVVFASGGNSVGKLESPLVIDPYDGKQIAMSGIAFSKQVYPVSQIEENLSAELVEDQVPLVSQGFQFVPSGSGHFQKNQPGAFYIEIYDPLQLGPKPSPLTIQVRVIDRTTGAQRVDASGAVPETKASNQVVPLGLKIPLETLPPGSYRLELKAMDSAGNATPPRSTDFEVE